MRSGIKTRSVTADERMTERGPPAYSADPNSVVDYKRGQATIQ